MQYIVANYPRLASLGDSSGRLPVELALVSGRSWQTGIQELVMANPSTLAQVDVTLGLYPFQLAALSKLPRLEESDDRGKRRRLTNEICGPSTMTEADELEQLDTIYNLLRHCPALVHG